MAAHEADLVAWRQEAHLESIDSAYVDSYRKLRAAAGQDGAQGNLIAEGHKTYMAFRRQLLHKKLLELQQDGSLQANSAASDRFALKSCGSLSAPPEQSCVMTSTPSLPEQQCSYMAWRRALLAHRFEARRGATDQEMIRRMAAEAMQRAIAAEAEARAEFAETLPGESVHAGGEGRGSSRTPGQDMEEAITAAWKVEKRLDGGDTVADPAVTAAMVALGLIPDPATDSRHGGSGPSAALAGAGGGGPLQEHPGMAGRLFSDVAAATLGASMVTAVAFLPIDPNDPTPGPESGESDTFAVGTDGGRVYLCSAGTGLVWAMLEGHEGPITGLDWARADGQIFLVTVSLDKTVRLWFVSTPMYSFPPPLPEPPVTRGARAASLPPQHRARAPSGAAAEQSQSGGSRSQSVGPTARRGRGGKGRGADPGALDAERSTARRVMVAEAQYRREVEAWRQGPKALGGSADCVQVIPTDYPLTSVLFSPLNPGLVVACAMEESDFNDWARARAEGAAQVVQLWQGGQTASEEEGQTAEMGQSVSEEGPPGELGAGTGLDSSTVGAGVGGAEEEGGAAGPQQLTMLTRKAADIFKKGIKKTMEGTKAVAGDAASVVSMMGRNMLVQGGAGGAPGGTGGAGGGNGQAGARRPLAARSGPKVHPRGYIMVFDAVGGRLIHSRRVQGSQVMGPTMSRPASFVTAMAWAGDGKTLYVADGKGLLHAYEAETEEARMGMRPLKEHTVIYGESALAAGGVLGLGREVKAGVEGLGRLGEALLGQDGAGEGTSAAESSQPFFTSLYYRHDAALRAPILVGLDSTGKVRAVTVPQQGAIGVGALAVDLGAIDQGLDKLLADPRDDVGRAVLAGIGSTVKASMQAGVALTKTAVAVSTLGAVQMATRPQAKELEGFVQYSTLTASPMPPAPARTFAGGMGLAGLAPDPSTLALQGGSTTAAKVGQALDAMFGRPGVATAATAGPGSHTTVVPFPAGDLLVSATASGDLYLLAPHGLPGRLARASKEMQLGMGDKAGADVAVHSGVTPAQVAVRLTGHSAPVVALAASPDGRFIVSADAAGAALVWAADAQRAR